VLVHGYVDIDADIVWEAAPNVVPTCRTLAGLERE
jgi:uncharacterized protein with HEPN domain